MGLPGDFGFCPKKSTKCDRYQVIFDSKQISRGYNVKTETNVIALSIFIGLIVWIIDAVLDYFIFYEGTFLDLLIFDVPNHEIYIRSVILFSFAIFGMIISKIMIKREQTGEALRLERDNFINILDTMEDGV